MIQQSVPRTPQTPLKTERTEFVSIFNETVYEQTNKCSKKISSKSLSVEIEGP